MLADLVDLAADMPWWVWLIVLAALVVLSWFALGARALRGAPLDTELWHGGEPPADPARDLARVLYLLQRGDSDHREIKS